MKSRQTDRQTDKQNNYNFIVNASVYYRYCPLQKAFNKKCCILIECNIPDSQKTVQST